MSKPRVFVIMNPSIDQDFGSVKQSIRMCIEDKVGQSHFTGDIILAVEKSYADDLEAKLKEANDLLSAAAGYIEDPPAQYSEAKVMVKQIDRFIAKIRGENG
jgi:hexokinase